MRRVELEHLIRASCAVAKQDQVLVVGSQAILGTFSEYELPEESTFSVEADVFPLHDDAVGSVATEIDGAIGEFSQFHQEFGFYAQGVDRRTAVLAPGWPSRLVPIRNENTGYNTGWCLEAHDVCASKLLANRAKDLEFVSALLSNDLVLVTTIRERIAASPVDAARQQIALGWLSSWNDVQPSYVAPEVPVVDPAWPNHPASVFEADPAPAAEIPASKYPWGDEWPGSAGTHAPPANPSPPTPSF